MSNTAISREIRKKLDDAWLNIDLEDHEIFDPLSFTLANGEPDKFVERLANLMSRPEYFYFICKEILNVEIAPFQCVILNELWSKKFPMLIGSRGLSKSFTLALYALLRMLLLPGRKVVVVGAAFRQSKVIFEYMENIWRGAPILRDLCDHMSGPSREPDRYIFRINDSQCVCLPLGNGDKIRGQRCHDLISDEFSSIPRDIFETVVAGFANVSASPINNIKKKAKERLAKELGIELEETLNLSFMSNQIILSGTAYYDWNHFAEYWKKYRAIVNSKGDKEKLAEIFGSYPSEDFDYRQFMIIRIPVELIPQGLMDAGQIDRARGTVHTGIFQMEYGAVFSKDSTGFYKRSLIESCVISNNNQINMPSCGSIHFTAKLKGDKKLNYVMAVDPASEVDNFSITILELWPDHRRIVYVWTTTRNRHKQMLKASLTSDDDFYTYCARKIRDLMGCFNIVEIAIDGQGGGVAVMESLHDRNRLKDGEIPIWPKIDPDEEKDTDDEVGLHIIEVVQFARGDWVSEANHGMRLDFENKLLLFPFFDGVSLAMSAEEDNKQNRIYDTLEDCVMEIEELKNELAMIVMTESATGRGKWDTPQTKTGKQNKLRKDRYSSLLMANMSGRKLFSKKPEITYQSTGGFAKKFSKDKQDTGPLYYAPNWFEGAYK